jgi:hypothetical protein
LLYTEALCNTPSPIRNLWHNPVRTCCFKTDKSGSRPARAKRYHGVVVSTCGPGYAGGITLAWAKTQGPIWKTAKAKPWLSGLLDWLEW